MAELKGTISSTQNIINGTLIKNISTDILYEDVQNKPRINNVELVGNKTTADLNLNLPTKTSQLTNDSGYLTSGDIYTKTDVDSALSTINTKIANKADKATTISGYAITDAYTKTETNNLLGAKAALSHTHTVDQITNFPTLAAVATSGSYNDLTNKPTIPTIPTKVSAFTNDAGYLTAHQDISGKADKATTLSGYGITDAYTKTEVDTALNLMAAQSTTYTKAEVDSAIAAAELVDTTAEV